MTINDDPLAAALHWHERGARIAVATVVQTWGSAPRPAGSVLVCNDTGEFVGSVSGGCVEAAIITAALEIIRGAEPRCLEFGVSDDEAWAVGLACGGRISVFVDRFDAATAAGLLTARAERRAVARIVALDGSGEQIDEHAAAEVMRTDRAVRTSRGKTELLIVPRNPPPRLVIVGAVHIAQALCAAAQLIGHEVIIIDPRSAFLRPSLFSGARLLGEWPQAALSLLGPDTRTACVTLTHDPKIDDPALEAVLRTDAYYVGALGSRRTHAQRLERLAQRGFDAPSLARIHGPAGLAIGAATPAEIAVSVLAQLVAALREAPQDSLSVKSHNAL